MTYHPQNSVPGQSKVINVSVASAANPSDGINPGSRVTARRLTHAFLR